jgi:predicted acyltransferase
MGLGYIWSLHFPLNKNIWTSSYVLYTAGLALLCFGLCYWFVDILGYKKWTKPFIIYGMNAITVFVLSGYVARLLGNLKLRVGMNHSAVSLKAVIYDNIYLPLFSPINASLAFALSYVLFWLFIMWIFYRKGVFLKI